MKRDPEKNREWRRRGVQKWRENMRERAQKRPAGRKAARRSHASPRRRPQPTTGFRLWVRATYVCAVPGCGKENPDPHHLKATGMGGRRDPWAHDERNAAPLCRAHHQLGDSPGWSWVRFQDELEVDLQAIADEVWGRWMALPAEERARWEGRAWRINQKNGVPASRARRPRG